MGLQTGLGKGAGDGRVTGPQMAGQPACAPVGGSVAGRVAHGGKNARLALGTLGVRGASAVARGQSGESLSKEALLPGVDGAIGARELASDRAKGVALGEQENNSGAARFFGRDAPASEAPLQFFALL